jgi:hypothetical protein
MPSLSPNPWCASWRDEPAMGQLGLRAVLRTIGDYATGARLEPATNGFPSQRSRNVPMKPKCLRNNVLEIFGRWCAHPADAWGKVVKLPAIADV